jgi:hypothetical protein
MKILRRRLIWLGVIFVNAALLIGCTALSSDTESTSTAPEPVARAEEDVPQYLDFDDILIPSEMQLDRDETYIVKSAGFTAGILSLKARVETASLIAFFENNMKKDNWQMVSQFKSPRTMMLFHKQSRLCLIDITEGTYYTTAKIWVAPVRSDIDSGILK